MNRLTTLLACSLIFLLSFKGFSYTPQLAVAAAAKKAVIEKNLVKGLESGNDGVMLDAVYYLGEYKCEAGIIPLMKILNDHKNDRMRIMAALALTKIGTGKSLYAVKQNSYLDDNESVRNFCFKFFAAAKGKKHSYIDN
ncbi:MAG: HEAT repeat domain-containing protein [Ignavibacteria bacterium]|nr:HEAT repeat domain-containing protein [Ignavibacteria bacterium]